MTIEKKQHLKDKIRQGSYKPLADIVLDEFIGRKSKRLSRGLRPIPFWWNSLILALLTIIFGTLVSLLVGEIEFFFSREVIWVVIWGVSFAFSMLVGVKIEFQLLTATLQNSIIDAIDSKVDLEDIENWMVSTFSQKKQFLTSVVFALSLLLLESFYFGELFSHTFPRFSFIFLSAIVYLQIGWTLWGLVPVSVLVYKLGYYKYELYIIDPSSSNVIRGLSNYLYGQLFIRAALGAIFTFGAAIFGFLESRGISAVVLAVWLILTVVFLNGQQSLSRIIRKAKRESLQEIQKKIRDITKEDITNKETMEIINRLADFHDRIRDERNSVFDLEAVLKFVQSLLLPLVASLLGNIEKILELLNDIFSFPK